MVLGKVSNALVHPHKLDKPAIAVSDEAPTQTAAAAPAELPPIGPKLAGANVEAGKALFQKQCFTCHTVDKGGANKVGPNLWDIVGRKKASHEGFSYSSALQAKGGDWTYEDINHMIFKPTAYVRGTKMAFAGLPKEQERADVIAYLRTMAELAAAAAVGTRDRQRGRIGSRRARRSGPTPRRCGAARSRRRYFRTGVDDRRQDRREPRHHRRPRGRDGDARAARPSTCPSTACSARSMARSAPMPSMSGCSTRSTAPRPSSPACRSSAR